ncbi:MAG: hypothetical protein AB7K09_22860 [Planctomycetota bacterium]
MTHVRYLTPFVIFLTLFLLSGAGTYYFYNEKMAMEAEIDAINRNQLKQGWVIDDANNLQGEIKLLNTPTGYFRSQEENSEAVVYAQQQIGADNYIGAMRYDTVWLRNEYDRLRRFNNAKSQHQLDYLGTSALKPADQLAKAKALHEELGRTYQTSIRFVMEDTGEAGSGVIADRNTLLREDRDRFTLIRTALSNQQAEIQSKIASIKSHLDALDKLVKADDTEVRKFEQDKIREAYANAAKDCDRLIYLLSYTRINDKETAIPGLIDSPAKRIAVRLSQHLDPNDLDYLRRPDKNPAAGDDPSAYINAVLNEPRGQKVKDVAFRSLVQDAYEVPSNRKYRLSNYYLGGITLEEVIDNQDMLIGMLQHMNHLLADRLMVSLAIYHYKDAAILRDGDNARWRGTVKEYRENATKNDGIGSQVNGNFEQLQQAEAGITGTVRDQKFEAEENIRDEFYDFLSGEVDKLKADIRKFTRSLDNITQIFYRTKQEGIRNDGILKLSGADGQIVYRDNVDKVYHIDLGRKDHVRRGMRFLVYSDNAGQTDVKALIEITRVPNHNFAICRLVVRFPGKGEIVVGDKIDNRLFHNGRFLRVACVGEFRPPNTTVSYEQITQYLLELGCEVQQGPDTNTDLVILAQPAENMVPFDDQIRNFLQLRQRVKLDEVQVNELMILFEDQ